MTKVDSRKKEEEEEKHGMVRSCIHVICIGLAVGLVDADEDEEPRADLRYRPPLHLRSVGYQTEKSR